MWVMGLDMLFMASARKPFVERLPRFLGGDSWIFPPLIGDFQPDLTVGAVVEDLYLLRSVVAHGQRIPEKPFRESRELTNANPARSSGNWPYTYPYVQILMTSALFLLVRSLRKIILEGSIDAICNEKKWRRRLGCAVQT